MPSPDDVIRRLRLLHSAHEQISALPAKEREAFLARIGEESPELAEELTKLLEIPNDLTLDDPLPTGVDCKTSTQTALADPDRIGPYRILERIGEGGMGVVYLAEQETPIRRRVAIKVIKLGMDTKEVIARFEAERQALAMMDHAGVSRVLDAGVTDSGRPYFVMEFVPGIPVTDYCDRHRLNIRERVELFSGICRAVHHAHQKGIIHRDLKPSNLLVTLQERKPVSKIIDFGVAKATNQRLTEHTYFTEHGKLIGTPEYMSPEQAEMTGLNVDTSTDIYSLGVLLYELLTGSLPFDPESLRTSSWDEIHRRLREEDPPPPSVRLKQMDQSAEEAAHERGTVSSSLAKTLHGELDWIVMKAIDKDRTRRYASAAELAQDIKNYVSNEPVLAGPPGTLYRLRKTLAKHKGLVLSATALVAFLAASLLVVAGLYVRAENARDQAVAERDKAERMADFFEKMLGWANPYSLDGRDPTIERMLDNAAEHIASGEIDDQPETAARILLRIGTLYRLLGKHNSALEHCSTGLAIREELFGESKDILSALALVTQANITLGRIEDARNATMRGLSICEEMQSEFVPNCADLLGHASEINRRIGNYAVAESLSTESIALLDANDKAYIASWVRLKKASILLDMGRLTEAERIGRDAHVKFLEIRGRGTLEEAHSLLYLGEIRISRGDYDGAESLLLQSIQIGEARLGANHPFLVDLFGLLGTVYFRQKNFEKAESSYLRGLAIHEMGQGENPADMTACLDGLGRLYTTIERYEEADSILSLSAAIYEDSPGFSALDHAANMAARGRLERETGNLGVSDSLYHNSLAFYDRAGIANHPAAKAIRREIAQSVR